MDSQVWIQLDLHAHRDEYEFLIALLADFETCGIWEHPEAGGIHLSAFFPADRSTAEFRKSFSTAMAQSKLASGFHLSKIRIDPSYWLQEARRSFRGFTIGQTFYIHPGWVEPSPYSPVCILMEPGRAFGTGTHESTRLALRNLEKAALGSRTVLDIGTGTGILAIAAAKLNPAAKVTAIDIDGQATRCAASNFLKNGVFHIHLVQAGVEAMASRWGLVVANLTGPVLDKLSAEIGRVTGGDLIVSGFACEASSMVVKSFSEYGFQKHRELVDRGWSSLHLRRFQ